MNVQIKRIILLLGLFWLPGQALFAQFYSSKNNYTGGWETSSSWNPTWTVPQTSNLSGYDISINGYITVNGSLSFAGTGSNLIINDTLVIKGNLLLENNTKVTVNDNGILIVRGNLTISNQTIIIANNYLIVAGDIIKNGSSLQGPFTSNDDPVKLFVGGKISPVELTNNYPNFPVINCTSPTTTPYPNSTCSYGNMTDIKSDPIDSFFQYTCTKANVNSNISVCDANTINLTSSIGITYSWSGPNGFTSNEQNPLRPNSNITMAGAYIITVKAAPGCTDTDTINVTINALPIATAGSNSPICSGNTINLTSSDGTGYSWGGPKGFTSNVQNPTIPNAKTSMEGAYTVTITAANGCKVTKTSNVIVNALPTASIKITDKSGIANNDGIICNSFTATLIASGGTSYIWSSGETTADITKGTAGTYTVTVTNANGCNDSKAATITVNALPTVAITITDNSGITNNDGIICNSFTATLIASGGTSYIWSSGETTAAITKGTAGTYTVTVTNANGCNDSNAATIIVNALPTVAITITDNSGIANDGIIYNGASALLTASGGTSYAWSSGETTAAITKDIAGTYTVTATNANGCANEAGAEVKVTVPDLFIPSVITPNGDGKNDYFKISGFTGKVELIIINRWGNEEYTSDNYLNDWDGRNNKGKELPNDTYFYILKLENNIIKKGSVLIKR